jgi:hypothetical protein
MLYQPDWERLSHALKRVVATGVPEHQAKRGICNAIADRKISLRVYFRVPKKQGPGLATSAVRYIEGDAIPAHLKPGDLNWVQSRIQNPKSWEKVRSPSGTLLGHWLLIETSHHTPDDSLARSFTSRGGRQPQFWHRLELLSADVTNVLCRGNRQKSYRVSGATVRDEKAAIKALASQLRSAPELTRAKAEIWCSEAGFELTGRGFQNRVWPMARTQAGLEAKAPPGAKRKSTR